MRNNQPRRRKSEYFDCHEKLDDDGGLPTIVFKFRIKKFEMRENCFNELQKKVCNSNKVSLYYCFQKCYGLSDFLFPKNFDTTNIIDLSGMFSECLNLATVDLSEFNTSCVTNMSYMFEGCSKLNTVDLSTFNTSIVIDMSHMFDGCKNLTSLYLSGFDTNNVTNMNSMFYGCHSLSSLDLSTFNTSSVGPDGSYSGCTDMFKDC